MAVVKFTDLQAEIGVGYLNTICKEENIPRQDLDDAKEPEKTWLTRIRAIVREMKRLKTTSVTKAIASLNAKQEAREDDKQYTQVTTDIGKLIQQRNERELDEMQELAVVRGEQKAAALEIVENMTTLQVYATGDYTDPNLATAVQQSKELLYAGILGGVQGYRTANFLKRLQSPSGIGSAPNPKPMPSSSTPLSSS